MTPFEYWVTIFLTALAGVGGIKFQEEWQRAVSILALFLLTIFAGTHGFKMQ